MISTICKQSIARLNGQISAIACRQFGGTTAQALPMKPGTVLKSLGVMKDQEPPVVKAREEYPAWVGELVEPPVTLAALRRMPDEEAHMRDISRFLKLSRRQLIQERNLQASV